LLFDGHADLQAGFGLQLPYSLRTTAEGGVEVDAGELARLAAQCLSAIHGQMREAGRQASAVACCTFWHSFLGVDEDGLPTTPIIHLFDTRSGRQVRRLAETLDPVAVHARTGCVLHTSYWPAKLLWLAENDPRAVGRTRQWRSFGEFFFERLFGRALTSTSMVSASGIWNSNIGDYDDPTLAALPIERKQLARPAELDEPARGLRGDYQRQWPEFASIPWFPAIGDGAANNIGSGCTTPRRFSLMVGTSGAMRAVVESAHIEPLPGLWCYRVDRRRWVVGGALSNGGEVFAWMNRTLSLPSSEETERALGEEAPGSHGLTVVPLFAGERSTGWRPEARAAIAGMSLHTRSIDILRAALESVALRFREIYEIMAVRMGAPDQLIASGGGLLHSPAWTQMMADALGRTVVTCLEPEATARGSALLAIERLGAISNIDDLPARTGRVFEPNPTHRKTYEALLERQRALYRKLFEDQGACRG